ncbi:hypothetical protein [Paenibacillus sp. 1P07SE]|uniref:hypothetical protein n=1 Tax=Paenibacillus sp. 1P07SE TaxID=3132209 RepID=UPI0039A632E0
MKRLLAGILLLAVMSMMMPANVQALNFAVYPFEEVVELSDEVLIGTIESKEGDIESWYLKYQVTVTAAIKGEAAAGETIPVQVLNWADEGVLHEGKTYLLILNATPDEDGYNVTGVHQGFIQLKDNGEIESRFFSQAEIEAYLAAHGIEPEAWTEKPSVQEEAAGETVNAPVESPQDGANIWLWAAVLALALAAVGLFMRYRRK